MLVFRTYVKISSVFAGAKTNQESVTSNCEDTNKALNSFVQQLQEGLVVLYGKTTVAEQ